MRSHIGLFFHKLMFTFFRSWYKVTFESGIFGSDAGFNRKEQDKCITALSVVALLTGLNGLQQKQKRLKLCLNY